LSSPAVVGSPTKVATAPLAGPVRARAWPLVDCGQRRQGEVRAGAPAACGDAWQLVAPAATEERACGAACAHPRRARGAVAVLGARQAVAPVLVALPVGPVAGRGALRANVPAQARAYERGEMGTNANGTRIIGILGNASTKKGGSLLYKYRTAAPLRTHTKVGPVQRWQRAKGHIIVVL